LQPNFVKSVNYFCSLDPVAKGYVLYAGQEGFYADTTLLPVKSVKRLLEE